MSFFKYLLGMKRKDKAEEELLFKEDRISDLLVERDTGVWRDKLRKELIKDEITFLELILKSNKGRDDCLIHMVKGRLDKLKSKENENGNKN